ncbi:MAG: alanine dehydrogenase [Legionellales bacterium]|nr:MAG: alanine dehydrogenase [Legionellales bacterium]
MLIGVPKEIKNHEYRVGLTPGSVSELTSRDHKVIIEHDAGEGCGFEDHDYIAAGATIVASAAEIFSKAELIVKVKEPQPQECKQLRPGQILFTYLHLAADVPQAELLAVSGCVAIAYETVTDKRGGLPLLAPMSEVAGRLSVQAGAHCLEKAKGGSGILLGGVPGVAPAKVTIIGGGVVGTNAAHIAVGMKAQVTILDKSLERLRYLDDIFDNKARLVYATGSAIEQYVTTADLVIGAVLVPGAAAPKLVSRDLLSKMHPGSVAVDVAIDQGGCFETSRPTTYADPTFVEHGVVHYCVANMPGGVPRTSTYALNNATLPYVMALANNGYKVACANDIHLANGLNVCHGKITHAAVAKAISQQHTPVTEVL